MLRAQHNSKRMSRKEIAPALGVAGLVSSLLASVVPAGAAGPVGDKSLPDILSHATITPSEEGAGAGTGVSIHRIQYYGAYGRNRYRSCCYGRRKK